MSHRRKRFALACAVSLCCTPPGLATPTRAEIESALRIRLAVDQEVIEIWDEFRAQASIENTSDDGSFNIVLPGDGSLAGWREPSIRYFADRFVDGQWERIPVGPVGFCGVYNPDWLPAIRTLEPGQIESIAYLGRTLDASWEFSTPGRYRVAIEYAYRANIPSKPNFGSPETNGYGTMEGYPEHTIRSNSAEFEVAAPPIEVRFTIGGNVGVLEQDSLSEHSALRISLVNQSDEDFNFDCNRKNFRAPWLYVRLLATRNGSWVGGGMLDVAIPESGILTIPAQGSIELEVLGATERFKRINLDPNEDKENLRIEVQVMPPDWPRPLISDPFDRPRRSEPPNLP